MPVPPKKASPEKKTASKKRLSDKQKKALRILTYIGVILLLLIPTYFAIGSYIMVKNAPVENTDTYYTSMELIGPNGTALAVSPASQESMNPEEGKIFDSFRKMLENVIYTTGVPENHTGKYQVRFQTNIGEEHYTFYFSTEKSTAYITKNDNTTWLTEDASVEYFLNSPYAYELYEQSTPPVLTTAATDVIIPTQLSWSYQTKDGTFANLAQFSVTDQVLTYPIANDIVFYFTRQPSSCHLTIWDNGSVLVDQDGVDGISLTQLTQGKLLDFEIEAFYGQTSANKYYGRAVYSFRMSVVEAASFFMNGIAAEASTTHQEIYGNYQMLCCLNVRNEQNLVITATPALKSNPIVFRRGDKVYAAIPADTVGERSLTVTYGTISSTFKLNIAEKADATDHEYADGALRGDFELALNGGWLDTHIASKGATADSDTAFKFTPGGAFGVIADNALPSIHFGDRLTITDNNEVTDRELPFELYQISGTVRALAAGTVLETGENDILGRYIIIDHGCGLYTWYCALGDIRVNLIKGHVVGKGDALGLAGRTGLGFSDSDGVLLMATWGKQAINPQYLRETPFDIS